MSAEIAVEKGRNSLARCFDDCDAPFLLPMGMLVLSKEAKELCLESWALAARALFHSALISMEAR